MDAYTHIHTHLHTDNTHAHGYIYAHMSMDTHTHSLYCYRVTFKLWYSQHCHVRVPMCTYMHHILESEWQRQQAFLNAWDQRQQQLGQDITIAEQIKLGDMTQKRHEQRYRKDATRTTWNQESESCTFLPKFRWKASWKPLEFLIVRREHNSDLPINSHRGVKQGNVRMYEW